MHTGYMLNSASLSTNNFKYVNMNIRGSAKVTYIFGMIGGLGTSELISDAKLNMLLKYPLKENQAIVNLTVSWTNTYILPFGIHRTCTVTADVVEFR